MKLLRALSVLVPFLCFLMAAIAFAAPYLLPEEILEPTPNLSSLKSGYEHLSQRDQTNVKGQPYGALWRNEHTREFHAVYDELRTLNSDLPPLVDDKPITSSPLYPCLITSESTSSLGSTTSDVTIPKIIGIYVYFDGHGSWPVCTLTDLQVTINVKMQRFWSLLGLLFTIIALALSTIVAPLAQGTTTTARIEQNGAITNSLAQRLTAIESRIDTIAPPSQQERPRDPHDPSLLVTSNKEGQNLDSPPTTDPKAP